MAGSVRRFFPVGGKNRPGKNRFWTGFSGGKNTLADRTISRERRCRGHALSNKEADLQFILSCNYPIVWHHVEPLFKIQHNRKNVNVRSILRRYVLIVPERRWKKLHLVGKKAEKTQFCWAKSGKNPEKTLRFWTEKSGKNPEK